MKEMLQNFTLLYRVIARAGRNLKFMRLPSSDRPHPWSNSMFCPAEAGGGMSPLLQTIGHRVIPSATFSNNSSAKGAATLLLALHKHLVSLHHPTQLRSHPIHQAQSRLHRSLHRLAPPQIPQTAAALHQLPLFLLKNRKTKTKSRRN